MRDKKRIKRIQDKLTLLWDKNSDWRWGQFLINCKLIPNDPKTWNLEDEKIEEELDKLLKK